MSIHQDLKELTGTTGRTPEMSTTTAQPVTAGETAHNDWFNRETIKDRLNRRKEMPLFEVAILERPTKKEAEEGKSERLVLGPIAVVATDQQSAAITAVLDGEKVELDRARMEVLVHPFA